MIFDWKCLSKRAINHLLLQVFCYSHDRGNGFPPTSAGPGWFEENCIFATFRRKLQRYRVVSVTRQSWAWFLTSWTSRDLCFFPRKCPRFAAARGQKLTWCWNMNEWYTTDSTDSNSTTKPRSRLCLKLWNWKLIPTSANVFLSPNYINPSGLDFAPEEL